MSPEIETLELEIEALNKVLSEKDEEIAKLKRDYQILIHENARIRQEVKKMSDWMTPVLCEYHASFPKVGPV